MFCPNCKGELALLLPPMDLYADVECMECGNKYSFDDPRLGGGHGIDPMADSNDDQFVQERYNTITGEYSSMYVPPEWID